jgi:putative transposase
MIKTYKFKLYHSRKNKYLNEQTKIAGNIYNHCISLKKRYYKMYGKSLNKFNLQKHLTKLKKLDKYSYWKKVNAQAIQDITDRIERSYQAFFNNCKKKSKTRKVSPPSFKKVRSYASVTFKQDGYKVLPLNQIKIGKKIYKYWKSREIEGEVKCVTIKKDSLGDWYIYFVCEIKNESKLISMTGKTAGFDFGCITFLTQDNGNKIKSPEFFKKNRKEISKASKKLSKKTQGSTNYKNAKRHLARLHKKIANKRNDFHFKLAKELCDSYDIMIFETLDIESMKKEHGKKINDLGFSNFMRILEWKALEYGKTISKIDKWFASTKICNNCGYKNDKLIQRDRSWICPLCNIKHDRDINAAINIINKGINELEFEKRDGASSCWREDVSLCDSKAVLT